MAHGGLDFNHPFSISSEGVPFRVMRQKVIGSAHGACSARHLHPIRNRLARAAMRRRPDQPSVA